MNKKQDANSFSLLIAYSSKSSNVATIVLEPIENRLFYLESWSKTIGKYSYSWSNLELHSFALLMPFKQERIETVEGQIPP